MSARAGDPFDGLWLFCEANFGKETVLFGTRYRLASTELLPRGDVRRPEGFEFRVQFLECEPPPFIAPPTLPML